jgi:hypothetical protein
MPLFVLVAIAVAPPGLPPISTETGTRFLCFTR